MCVCGAGIEKTFRDNLQKLREQLQKSETQGVCGVRPDSSLTVRLAAPHGVCCVTDQCAEREGRRGKVERRPWM